MSLIKEIEVLKSEIKKSSNGKDITVGFVPTMGYLHKGHMSLIKRAKKENDLVVVSVFVNPTQFAPGEDLETYPKDIEKDYENSIKAGADIVFNPDASEIYGEDDSTFVIVEGDITKKLCGRSRPTHFKGVTTVVAKLFNIVKPNNAYFGQKDAQQVAVIEKMVRDLNMDVNIIACELIREEDGLAMSSRNERLSAEDKLEAILISQTLYKVRTDFGKKPLAEIVEEVSKTFEKNPHFTLEYFEIANADTLLTATEIVAGEKYQAFIAVFINNIRLIDTISLN